MKHVIATALVGLLAAPALADGHIASGEKAFKKCKACHAITAPDGTSIVKGGKTGPNLYGIAGAPAAAVEGYKYSASLKAAGEAGLVWDKENFVEWLKNPKDFIKKATGDSKAKTKMSFKLKKGAEDIYAYLESVAQ